MYTCHTATWQTVSTKIKNQLFSIAFYVMSYLKKFIAKLLKHFTGHEQVACLKHAICHSVPFLYFDVFIAEQEL